jgi:predicted RNase H-like HicB family nuclease
LRPVFVDEAGERFVASASCDSNATKGTDMKLIRTATSVLLLAAIASTAHAETAKTREEVKAELREAIRTGEVLVGGDNSGVKLNELYPDRYPRVAASTKTRAEVRAELAQAIREGTLVAAGEGALTPRDEFPQRFPAVAVAPGRTREEVVAETREAIRSGDVYAAGEAAMKLNEEYPQRYAKQRAVFTAQAGRGAASATAR